MPKQPPPTLERLLARCGPPTERGCREWERGARDKDGYGRFTWNDRTHPAHVWVLELATGHEQQPGECGLHSCDNPPCCEPSHLRWGSKADNMADAKARGRLAFGERNPNAKLSVESADRLRARAVEIGDVHGRWMTLSREFGISDVQCKNIVTGKRRKQEMGAARCDFCQLVGDHLDDCPVPKRGRPPKASQAQTP